MNSKESKEFLEAVLVAFPGVNQWLKNASPNFDATKALWARTLEQIEMSEGMSVLARWSSGKLPAPEGYAKENFHLHIIAVVKQDRAKAARERTRETTLQEHTRTGKSFYRAILGPFMAQVLSVQKRYVAGEIGYDERDKLIDALVADATTKVDRVSA